MEINNNKYLKIKISRDLMSYFQQVISSYFGHFSHANSYNLIKTIMEKHSWLKDLFIFYPDRKIVQNRLVYKGHFKTLRHQAAFFQSRFERCICLFYMGRYIEIYNNEAIIMNKLCKLQIINGARKMKYTAGFPKKFKDLFLEKILFSGFGAILISEGERGKYLRNRYVSEIYQPLVSRL